MTYVMSDLHGCYDKYAQMLEKISFGEGDTLYILGDVIDRGEDGIKILLDMTGRKNVIPLKGNHEEMALSVLNAIRRSSPYENTRSHILWMLNDGAPTKEAFLRLSQTEKEAVFDYVFSFGLRLEITVNGRKFHLSHTLPEYDPCLPLSETPAREFLWGEPDYETAYAPDMLFVTGHTPTHVIDPAYKWRIWQGCGHIAIDCAAAFGGRLGCLCLETMEKYNI